MASEVLFHLLVYYPSDISLLASLQFRQLNAVKEDANINVFRQVGPDPPSPPKPAQPIAQPRSQSASG